MAVIAIAEYKEHSADGTHQPVDEEHPLPVFLVGGTASDREEIVITGTVAALGLTPLVAAPGPGLRIQVTAFVIQNEAALPVTITLYNGPNPAWRVLGQNQGDGLALVFASAHPWRLDVNTALQINLSAARQCGYSIKYYTA